MVVVAPNPVRNIMAHAIMSVIRSVLVGFGTVVRSALSSNNFVVHDLSSICLSSVNGRARVWSVLVVVVTSVLPCGVVVVASVSNAQLHRVTVDVVASVSSCRNVTVVIEFLVPRASVVYRKSQSPIVIVPVHISAVVTRIVDVRCHVGREASAWDALRVLTKTKPFTIVVVSALVFVVVTIRMWTKL